MGLFDIIFGKKSANAIRKVQKAAAVLSEKPKSQNKATLPKNAEVPKIEWKKSVKGNDTAEINDYRITIFKQNDEWNYCIAEILDEQDIADGVEDDVYFGEGYSTKAAARRAALDEVI